MNDIPKKISKIVIDRDLCIGAASCIVISPDVFELDEENKAVIKDPDADTVKNIIAAAESCPTKAIFVYDEDGKQVYPK